MMRMLLIEDDVPAAELTMHRLKSGGLEFSWERVESESAFREALSRVPDIILSDSQVPGFNGMAALRIAKREAPGTPFVFVSGNGDQRTARLALDKGATAFVSKAENPDVLATTVRQALGQRGSQMRRRRESSRDASGIAAYLLERRAVLDSTLQEQDRSAMSAIMRRTPPSPLALLAIQSSVTRERFIKLLQNANIEVDVPGTTAVAIRELDHRTHAVMFTDDVECIRNARQLHAGAATHIVFINSREDKETAEALQVGANDCMPAQPEGAEFWTHLTTVRRIVSLAASLQLALDDNRILSTVDELTRCGSRRFFDREFPREIERASRLRHPLGLILCDLDHFKRINDRHGHQAGDEVLREFADRVTSALRLGEDWLARIGGEEFAVVLPETSADEAYEIAERLRRRIADVPVMTSRNAVSVSASFGVCGFAGNGQRAGGLAEKLIDCADGALYESKRKGRDRVTRGRLR